MTTQSIISAVSEVTGVSVPEIVGKGRKDGKVQARQLAIFITMKLLPETRLSELARQFGYSDHTMAIHCINRIEDDIKTGAGTYPMYLKVMEHLGVRAQSTYSILQRDDYPISVTNSKDVVLLQQEGSVMTLTADTIKKLYLNTLLRA